MIYINLYKIDKAYGGNEEGGWWFLFGEPLRSYPMFSPRRAEVLKRRLERVCDRANEHRPDIDSVNSEGVFTVWTESHPAEHFPKETPRYE